MFRVPAATACAVFAMVTAITALPAAAKDRAWQVGNQSVHLYYTNLDLNSAAGRAELLARTTRAAQKLCRDRVDARDCVADTLAETSRLSQAAALRLAIAERDAVLLAAK
jgi:UrcA family protein